MCRRPEQIEVVNIPCHCPSSLEGCFRRLKVVRAALYQWQRHRDRRVVFLGRSPRGERGGRAAAGLKLQQDRRLWNRHRRFVRANNTDVQAHFHLFFPLKDSYQCATFYISHTPSRHDFCCGVARDFDLVRRSGRQSPRGECQSPTRGFSDEQGGATRASGSVLLGQRSFRSFPVQRRGRCGEQTTMVCGERRLLFLFTLFWLVVVVAGWSMMEKVEHRSVGGGLLRTARCCSFR